MQRMPQLAGKKQNKTKKPPGPCLTHAHAGFSREGGAGDRAFARWSRVGCGMRLRRFRAAEFVRRSGPVSDHGGGAFSSA